MATAKVKAKTKTELRRTIQVIEDDPYVLNALSAKLDREGYKVIKAEDGVEGLKKALSYHPDLILLDVIMPKMDGMSMLLELRKDTWGKDVPVIILTNLSSISNFADVLETNKVSDYLVKANWSLRDLIKKIREKLPKNKASAK